MKCVGPEKGFIESTFAAETDKDKVIRTQYFKHWNEPIVTAEGMSLLAKLFEDKEVKTDLSTMMKANEKANTTGIWSVEDHKVDLTADEIKSMVSAYNTTDKDGVGVAVIAKKFGKSEGRAYFVLAFFDLNSKELIPAADILSKPMWGISVYTYCFDSVKYALRKVRDDYEDWADDYK